MLTIDIKIIGNIRSYTVKDLKVHKCGITRK